MKKLLYLFLAISVACSSGDDSTTPDSNDTTPPVITLIGSANVLVTQGDNYIDEGATATDNVDGDLTSSISVSGNVDTATIGNYTLTYSVSDSSGNSASAIRNVNVVQAPVCANGEVVYLDANGVTIKACPDAQIGDTGNVNGFTYTIVSEQQLRDYVNSGNLELNRLVTTQVTNMSQLFQFSQVNQDISSWDVSNVTDMGYMFASSVYNQPIGDWDVSNVTNMTAMFLASAFNQPIGDWDVSNVTIMDGMFSWGSFDQPIGDWDVSNVTSMQGMFDLCPFNQPIGNWDVSNVTNMAAMFQDADQFNQDLSEWNVENVEFCNFFYLGADNWTLPKPNFTNCVP